MRTYRRFTIKLLFIALKLCPLSVHTDSIACKS